MTTAAIQAEKLKLMERIMALKNGENMKHLNEVVEGMLLDEAGQLPVLDEQDLAALEEGEKDLREGNYTTYETVAEAMQQIFGPDMISRRTRNKKDAA